MARHERTNPDGPNFGLGSRNMIRAGLHALREGMQSYSSIATMHDRWRMFAKFAKEELSLHTLKQVETSHLQVYAEHLSTRYEAGKISAATAQNYLSAVNRVMEIARGDRAVRLDPVKDAGLPKRSGICTESRAVPLDAHQRAAESVSARLGVMMNLQRELGLRFEESAKIDTNRALIQAEKTDQVRIFDGTKGGRARIVPIVRPEQLTALRAAAAIQGRDRSMIPADQTYSQFRAEAYKEIERSGITFHGERHHYAQQRYQAIVGASCPVAAGVPHKEQHQHLGRALGITREQARELDHAARMQVANELGHGRICVTNSYLG